MRVSAVVLVTTLLVSLSTQAAPPGRAPRAEDVTGSGEWTVRSLSRSAPEDALAVADCHADPNVFCMSYSRVNVGVTWVNPYSGIGGTAGVLPQNDEFAFFYYADPKNPEVFVKVLGDNNPNYIQLFVGGTTDFEYTVTFSGCGTVVTFHKPPYVFTGTVNANEIPNPSCARGVVWAAQSPVTSLNGLRGDLTLAAGTDLTLTPSGQTLTLAANSSPGNTANTLVRRDGSGSFSAGTITASLTGNVTGNVTGAASANVLKAGDTMTGTLSLNPGNINLTSSSATSGNILKNGALFLHDFGSLNVFLGQATGNVTMTGTANTAIGVATLPSNTTGYYDTAIGYSALNKNTTGYQNSASGYAALFSNTTGLANTASGSQALYNNNGSDNTAIGFAALSGNTTGSYNTASGFQALQSYTTGSYNTGVGTGAGTSSDPITAYGGGMISLVPGTTGSYNTFLGRRTGATAQVMNCTAVGVDAYCTGDNQVRLGNVYVSSIGGTVGWSALSDIRAKKDVRDLSRGLDLIMALRPVEYRMRKGNERLDMGFVAQDVEALLGDGYNVLDVGGDEDRTLSLRYTDLIAPLVRAIQEQQREIELLRQERSALAEGLSRLEERVVRAEAQARSSFH